MFSLSTFQPRELLLQLLRRQRIRLVERDDLDLVGEAIAVSFEFVAHRLVGFARVFAGAVDDVQQHAAALDMAEEAVAEPDAVVRALDQPRQIREHEVAIVDAHHAELRMQGGERIVGDLRLGGADRRKERGLAGIRQPDQAGVGDQLQPQSYCPFFTRKTRIGAARRAIGQRLEIGVAEPPLPPFASTTRSPTVARSASSVSPSSS